MSKTLCSSIGTAEIQFNVYGFNDMQIDELLLALNTLLESYDNLAAYRIINTIRGVTKLASSFSAEVGVGISRYEFKYENL